jgi:hypothetical protein
MEGGVDSGAPTRQEERRGSARWRPRGKKKGGGSARRCVEERRGPSRGTNHGAAEVGGAPCGNRGGRRGWPAREVGPIR